MRVRKELVGTGKKCLSSSPRELKIPQRSHLDKFHSVLLSYKISKYE